MKRFLPTLLALTTACSRSKPVDEPAPKGQHTAAELGPMCERYYVKQRSCVTEYLRALVSVRAEYDMPKGIAAHVKEAGLDAVVAEAKTEWDVDSAPEKTAAICQGMAEKTPPEHVDRLLAAGAQCEAMADCTAFAKCAVDTERTYIREGLQH